MTEKEKKLLYATCFGLMAVMVVLIIILDKQEKMAQYLCCVGDNQEKMANYLDQKAAEEVAKT